TAVEARLPAMAIYLRQIRRLTHRNRGQARSCKVGAYTNPVGDNLLARHSLRCVKHTASRTSSLLQGAALFLELHDVRLALAATKRAAVARRAVGDAASVDCRTGHRLRHWHRGGQPALVARAASAPSRWRLHSCVPGHSAAGATAV